MNQKIIDRGRCYMEEKSRKKLEDCELNFDFKFDFSHDKISDDKKDESKKDDDSERFYPTNLQGWLVLITSSMAIIASVVVLFNKIVDFNFAVSAEAFYRVPRQLFFDDKLFGYYLNFLFAGFYLLLLFLPFFISSKYRYRKLEKFDAIFLSAFFGIILSILNIIAVYIVFDKNLIVINENIVWKYIAFILLFTIFGNYKIITLANKFNYKESKENDDNNIRVKKGINKENIAYFIKSIPLIIYMLFMLVGIIGFISSMNIPNRYAEDIRNYEIIKGEENYNVIVGYKDGRAITLTGDESSLGGKISLNFTSNEYMLQDVKNKVIVNKTFDKVVPYKFPKPISGSNGSENKAVD